MPTVPPATRSMVAAILVIAATIGVAGCRTAADNRLDGIVRTPRPVVADVRLPDVRHDDNGVPFRFVAAHHSLLGVYFGFTTCPDLCPETMGDLRAVLHAMGNDAKRVSIAFVTVDPQHDTPAALRSFLDHFVPDAHAIRTADATTLQAAEAAFRVAARRTGPNYVEHSAAVLVVDDRGTIVDELPYGLSHDQMRHDLSVLLARYDKESQQ